MPDRAQGIEDLATDTHLGSASWTETAEVRIPGLTILWHPDVRRIGERAPLAGLASGRSHLLSRLDPEFLHPGGGPRHPLGDAGLSRSPIHLVPAADGGVLVELAGSRTRVEVDGAALERTHEIPAERLERGAVLSLADRVVLLLHRLDPIVPDLPRHGLIGESSGLHKVRSAIDQLCDLDVTVLLRGETGTGKELVARALHDASPRSGGPFVAVNMAAVPASLAAAELFGASKGAFTGADHRRTGYFQRAQGGTLLLDEIGETPPEIQALLLRALETHEIQPVGAESATRIDVRVISSTDLDLETAVQGDRFKAPLLYRLAGFSLQIPPLRQRMEDFGRLFVHFLRRELTALDQHQMLDDPARPWIAASIVARLARHDWPGNVRQLAGAARQLVIANRAHGRVRVTEPIADLLAEPAPRHAAQSPPSAERGGAPAPPPGRRRVARRPSDVREDELRDALRRNRFRLQQTADDLGITRASLYDLIDKSPTIRKASQLTAEEVAAALEEVAGSAQKAAEQLEVSEQALRRRMGQLGLS